jgi:4-amino-4-deoxy-L-arabinose transferase-like glycosyltransferase
MARRQRLANVANLLLPAGLVLAVVGLAIGVMHRVIPGNPLETTGPVLLAASALMFGFSFLARAAARPPGGERNRYVGVGIVGVLGAVAIWIRDVWHLGPTGSWLWLILVLLAGVAGILLYWDDLRGRST